MHAVPSIVIDKRFENVVEEIELKYGDIRIVKNPILGTLTRMYDHSMMISLLPSEIGKVEEKYPHFRVSHVYGNQYNIYFNKPINWGILRMPDLI